MWIEISAYRRRNYWISVTPLAGVWIEICHALQPRHTVLSSLPLRECGLKYSPFVSRNRQQAVTPLAGVWIEIQGQGKKQINEYSHSPCGSVDWNRQVSDKAGKTWVTPLAGVWIEMTIKNYYRRNQMVTPLAGVWIEMNIRSSKRTASTSLPLRECGLKFTRGCPRGCDFCHSPCGSVDWNTISA